MRRVLSNFAWLSAASVAAQLVGAVALLYLARKVTPDAYGMLAFVQAIANLGFLVGDMGLGRLGTQLVSTGQQVQSAVDIVCLRVCLNLMVLASMIVISLAAGVSKNEQILLVLTALATTMLALAPDFVWTSMQSMAAYSAIQTVQLTLRALGIVALAALTGSVISVPVATLVTAAIGTLLFWRMLPAQVVAHVDVRTWPRYLIRALPIGLAAMMPNLYINSDTIMVKGFLGIHQLALYAAAYRIIIVPLSLGGVFVTALFPALCRLGPTTREGRSVARRALLFGTGAGLLIACVGALASTQLMTLLYGPAFRGAGDAFQVLSLVPIVAIPALVLSSTMVASGRARFNLFVIMGGGLINLGLDAILMPTFGIRGAGLATFAAESAVLAALLTRWNWSPRVSWRPNTWRAA